MHDAKKIIAGIIIFLILITIPVWYTVAAGKASAVPEPEIITDAEECIEDTEYMREFHMTLLDEWRWSVVREGDRTYIAKDGEEWTVSLRGTCMKCHSNKAEFCDRCHEYAGIKPDCWQCHVSPEDVP